MIFSEIEAAEFSYAWKSAYHTGNASSLGVKLRRFQQWFIAYEQDLEKIAKKAEPKLEKSRYQNKVVCQAECTKWTATQKLDFYKEWDTMKAKDASFTQK